MDESGDTKEANKPNRRTRILERRMQSLAGFGMFGEDERKLADSLDGRASQPATPRTGPQGNHIRGISSPQRLPRQASTCKSAGLRGRGR